MEPFPAWNVTIVYYAEIHAALLAFNCDFVLTNHTGRSYKISVYISLSTGVLYD